MLQPIHGGAAARPFRTTHNALGITFCTADRDELYLKRCLVGGLERVYEFAKDFRNEGMDRTHQPEFTMVECYQAYADYRAGMELVEELVAAACEAANGSDPDCEYQGRELDFTSAVGSRLPYFEGIERGTGRTSPPWTRRSCAASARSTMFDLPGDPSSPKMLDELFGARRAEQDLFRPTFVIDHAQDAVAALEGEAGSAAPRRALRADRRRGWRWGTGSPS